MKKYQIFYKYGRQRKWKPGIITFCWDTIMKTAEAFRQQLIDDGYKEVVICVTDITEIS